MESKPERRFVVYEPKPVTRTSTLRFKPLGYVLENDKVTDELYEFNGKKTYTFDGRDDVYARIYRSHLTDMFIIGTTKFPVMYLSINYQQKLVMGNLFNVTLYFEMLSDPKSFKNFRQFITSELYGKFYLEIGEGPDMKKIDLPNFPGYEKMCTTMIDLIRQEDFSERIDKEMEKRRESRREQMGAMDEIITPPDENKVLNWEKMIAEYQKTGKVEM